MTAIRPAYAGIWAAGSIILIAMLALAGCSQSSNSAQWSASNVGLPARGTGLNPGPRAVIDLSSDWRFIRADRLQAEQPDFDDSHWTKISLPHTWNNLDGEDGGDNYYRGAGWYRRHLHLGGWGHEVTGRRLFLKFDGAASVADVYVNGRRAGTHKGMFAAFCFDITPLLNLNGDNVIAVRVDNAPRTDVPPLSADFTFFGGLYRQAHLLVLDPLCISPVDDAGPGVYVKQAKVTADAADLQITTKLYDTATPHPGETVRAQLLDAAGKEVAQQTAPIDSARPLAGDSVMVPLHIDHPHLWNARKDPYLYQARVTLTDGSRVTDEVVQPVGLRFFNVDPDRGFILNGQSYPLHGVNRHQDRIDMGWAITPLQHSQDFNLIMEMGCTAIRLAHYQHAQEFYDLCDRGGLVVWAEACLVKRVTDSPQFDQTALQQLRELIKQNYNHPSICFWSVFNELGNGNTGTAAQRQRQTQHQLDLVKRLNDLAHQLDDTRLTTGASNRPDPRNPLNTITDIIGINRYNGWYRDPLDSWAKELDSIHAALPDRAAGISEYGAGASIFQHEVPTTQPSAGGLWHPEEYQSHFHEVAYAAMKQRPWLWGTFIWNMFDFASDGRHEGDHPGRNDKGLVTYDRKTKKDAFYFYKANWSDEPVLYITDRRFTPRPPGTAGVKVYSNFDSVDLRINGTLLGTQHGNDVHVFTWPDAQLQAGDNQIEAIGMKDGKTYRDACKIVVDPNYRIEHPTTQPYYVP